MQHATTLLALAGLGLAAAAPAQTYVRVRDHVVAARSAAGTPAPSLTSSTAQPCGVASAAHDWLPIANDPGNQVLVAAYMNPACTNRHGAIAFVADASGARNQGVFVADNGTVRAIAMGSGQGGGSGQHGTLGDPTPIGGTFGGFFGGTVFAPPIDDDGDVLFLADVANGSASRALFLFQAGTQSILKVCAVGDPSPYGGTITALGPGSLGPDRNVVFLAASTGSPQYVCDLLQFHNGAVTGFLATNDPAPGGATVAMLGTESFGFVDGTTIFAGPVPSQNACGQVAFRILTNGGTVGRGIAVRTNGVDSWYLTDAMATPNGGTYFDFQAAAINGYGEIAVFSDYMLSGNPTSGWFAGSPGSFRHVLSFYDPVDNLTVRGLAFSRAPMTPFSDGGDLIVWCDVDPTGNGNMGRIVLCAADGSRVVLARQNGPTGAGGNYGWIDAWPSMTSNGRTCVASGTPGAPWTSAYLRHSLCGPAVQSSPCTEVGDSVVVDDFGPAGASFVLLASLTTQILPMPPYGDLLIGGATPVVTVLGITPYPGTAGPHSLSFPIPNVPAYAGIQLHYQAIALTGSTIAFTNRTTTTLR